MPDECDRDRMQQQVLDWTRATFGAASAEAAERARRFFEEAAELAQAAGVTRMQALAVALHVYDKPPGDPFQEAGGVGVSLLALCGALGISASSAESVEWLRVLGVDPAHFRERNDAKAAAGIAVPSSAPVCQTCNDSHEMTLHSESGDARKVMCTRCPVPCQKCRAGGNGPFCETTPCPCECHRDKAGRRGGFDPDPFGTQKANPPKIPDGSPATTDAPAEPADPRPLCIRCGKRWAPNEGLDATAYPCNECFDEEKRAMIGTLLPDVPRIAAPTDASIATEPDDAVLERIRSAGWMVVCHNDYRLKGELWTFWSFARGDEYVKGEGRSDREALEACEDAIAGRNGSR